MSFQGTANLDSTATSKPPRAAESGQKENVRQNSVPSASMAIPRAKAGGNVKYAVSSSPPVRSPSLSESPKVCTLKFVNG